MTELHSLDLLATMFRGGSDEVALPSAPDDWLGTLAIANRHYLVPALHCALSRRGIIGAVPEDVREFLALFAELNEARNRAIRGQIIEIIAALNESGIEPLLLKGSIGIFDERLTIPGRMVGDIDVLVPEESVHLALAALSDRGFVAVKDQVSDSHTTADLARDGDVAPVDLHHELVAAQFRYLLPVRDVFGRAQHFERDDLHYRIPSAFDRALHLFLHAQLHNGFYYARCLALRWAHECATIGPVVDWPDIERWARKHCLEPALQTFLLTAERLFGHPWPLSAPAGQLARRRFIRCCEREIEDEGRSGVWRWHEIPDLFFAADLLAARFGGHHSYFGNVARQLLRAPSAALSRVLAICS